MRLVTSTEQRTIELAAVKQGISVRDMIERAGQSIYEFIAERGEIADCAVVVLCGRGGNGADGFVAARRLIQGGARPVIVLCCGTPVGDSAEEAYTAAVVAGVPVLNLETEHSLVASTVPGAGLIIDAVFGLGFKGRLPRQVEALFELINAAQAEVIAVDVPSGIDADTGIAAPGTLVADVTLCAVGRKPAHVYKISRRYCGKQVQLDAGIPDAVFDSVLNVTHELTADVVAGLLPPRNEAADKRRFGSLICAAGSDRYRGAAVLCAKGALASGAGLLYIASTKRTLDAVAAHCPEVILLDLDDDRPGFSEACRRATAFVLGCGLDPHAADALTGLILSEANCPAVVDAEGINALSRNINIVKEHSFPLVLTPHIGEFARLVDADPQEVYQNRIRLARDYASTYRLVMVLKSDNTIIALPDGQVYINTIGNAGLAKGGSGDLLSGIIGSLCAMGLEVGQAALLGVWLHSAAADVAARTIPEHAITPSIVADCLPKAMGELKNNDS